MIFSIEFHNFRVCGCWDCYLHRHPGVCDRTMSPYEPKGIRMSEFNFTDEQLQQLSDAFGDSISDVAKEVARAFALWGIDFDDKNTANDFVAFITYYASSGAYAGRQEKYKPEKFRTHLLKAAGLCIAAVAAIDRNGDCAPRHYEKQQFAGAKNDKE